MALNLRTVGDYFLLDWNEVPGKPKAAWTPLIGQLVVRDTTQDNGFDLAANNEAPVGIVITTNGVTGTIGVAEFVPGTTVILPTDAVVALGDKVLATATGLATVGTMGFSRSEVKADAGGVGVVIDLAPFGSAGGATSTATVRF